MSLNINEVSSRFCIENFDETVGKTSDEEVSLISFKARHGVNEDIVVVFMGSYEIHFSWRRIDFIV